MWIEKISYRVVEMESGDFLLQESIEGGEWAQANGTYEYATAARAIDTFKAAVETRDRMVASFTVKSVVMTEGDLD